MKRPISRDDVRTGDLDDAALRAFLASDYRRLVGAFRVIAGSRAAAEDAVEEALARAVERSRRGERIDDLTTWVAVVAKNLLRSAFRRSLVERRARRRLADTPVSYEAAATHEHDDLLQAVASLPRRQREAVALHYFADMSVAGVARVTSSTEGAVKVLLHRSRRSLAATLGEPEDDEEVAEHVEH